MTTRPGAEQPVNSYETNRIRKLELDLLTAQARIRALEAKLAAGQQ
jgi:hypothetical protein